VCFLCVYVCVRVFACFLLVVGLCALVCVFLRLYARVRAFKCNACVCVSVSL
jgi:hypothetical protein